MFQLRWSELLPGCIGDAWFAEWCVDRLVMCADVHAWLVEHHR